ncbi:hypothetical protein [Nonomuraea longicatena]|uniref:Integral membrane protein n=1 Tax=Nonomuraea longicatena TaxID=83682 RepID=A0ABN1PXP6_9ACTN
MRPWLKIFLIGLALWVASVAVTLLTANSNLVPTVVLLGSLLVPVTFVVWAYGRGRSAEVTVELLFKAFVIGGVLGVLGASILESYLHPSLLMYVGVGLIEEGVKLAARVLLAYLGVSLLHALWDSMSAIAIAITLFLAGKPWQFQSLRIGKVPDVTEAQVHLYTVLNWGGLIVISAAALLWLRALSRSPRGG